MLILALVGSMILHLILYVLPYVAP